MKEIFALTVKDLRLLLRDKAGFFFVFFFPLMIAVFFGLIFSGGGSGTGKIPILVVDEDQSLKSKEYVAVLDTAQELDVQLSDRQTAVNQVRRGKKTAFVAIEKGFGESRKNIFWGDPPKVELGVDPSRKAEAGMLQGILTKYAVQDMQKLFSDNQAMRDNVKDALQQAKTDPGIPEDFRGDLQRFLGELDLFLKSESGESQDTSDAFSGFEPLKIEKVSITVQREGPNNSFAVSFPQGIIWGIIGTTIGFGVTLVTERTRGTLIRMRIAPISSWQILAGKGLACFLMTLSISVSLMALAILFFGVKPNSFPLLGLAFIGTSVCFSGIMMLLAVPGKTEAAANGISWSIMMILAMFGGGMVPIFIMPSWMQSLSHFSPVKWSMLALEGALWREFTLNEMLVPVGILLGVGIVFFAAGVRFFRWLE